MKRSRTCLGTRMVRYLSRPRQTAILSRQDEDARHTRKAVDYTLGTNLEKCCYFCWRVERACCFWCCRWFQCFHRRVVSMRLAGSGSKLLSARWVALGIADWQRPHEVQLRVAARRYIFLDMQTFCSYTLSLAFSRTLRNKAEAMAFEKLVNLLRESCKLFSKNCYFCQFASASIVC
jgi:hypothetical protein